MVKQNSRCPNFTIKIQYVNKEIKVMENFEITVNLKEASFSIKGTEDFVDRKAKEFIEIMKELDLNLSPAIGDNSLETRVVERPIANLIGQENICQKYIDAGLISLDGEQVYILRQVPGKTNAVKMKNVALITLYALNKDIEAKSIIQNCEKLNCFDSSNFSSVFKNDKSGNFVRKGKGQSWTLSLTIPGKETAVQVLEEMYSNAIKK